VSLTLEQAAAFLHMHPETLRERAKAGIVPASKPGKCWVFLQEDLEGYLRACRYTKGETPGGSTSSTKGSVLDAVVRRAIETTHRKFTIRSVPNSGTSSPQAARRSTKHSTNGKRPALATVPTNTD
jgi:hypothetical protein